MSCVRRGWARLRSLIRVNRMDRDFDDEAASHIALAAEDYLRRGMTETDARRMAQNRFGPVAAARDWHRDSRSLPWLDECVFDVRLILRGLTRDRGYAGAVIATLTLAIALNATVYTIVQAMLFRGLPLATESNRLVYLQVRKPGTSWGVPFRDFEAWRTRARTLKGMAFGTGNRPVTLRGGDGPPLEMGMQRVTVNAFGLLGVQPMLGRDFGPADERPGADAVAIISHPFWVSRFGKRPDIVGTTVRVDDEAVTVVGVMPEGFVFVYDQNLWMPMISRPALSDRLFGFLAYGRLRDGSTLEDAQADIAAINGQLEAEDPSTDRSIAPSVLNYSEAHIGPDAGTIYGSLWVGAWLVLLIACANVANLTLVRTQRRWREVSTRLALGAGHWRVMRQQLLESLLLVFVSAVVSWWVTRSAVPVWAGATASRYVALDYRVDGGVLRYLIGISCAVTLLCALVPLVRIAQLGAGGGLRGDARGVTRSLRGKHLSAAMVAGQMALAIVLLSGAGVLVRSLMNIVGAESGVRDPEHVVVGAVRLPPDRYLSLETRHAFLERLDQALRTLPGADAASLASPPPALGSGMPRTIEIEGTPSAPGKEPVTQFLTAGPDYFRVLGLSPMSGRPFATSDRLDAPRAAIVNRQFARMFWPAGNAVGRRLRAIGQDGPGEWLTIVGVVPDVMQGDPIRQEFKPLVYVPYRQDAVTLAWNRAGCCFRGVNFAIRTEVAVAQMAGALRAALQRIDADVTLDEISTVKANFSFNRDLMDLEHAELGKHAAVAPVFAVTALLLAALGLYAVISHAVGQRTREIGVRIVVGAASRDIRSLILREGMAPVVLGLLAGLTLSLAVNRVLQSQLVGVSPYDPLTFVAAPALLLMVAVIACYIPSERALKVDPAITLRSE